MPLFVTVFCALFLCLRLFVEAQYIVTGPGCNCLREEDCDPREGLCRGKCARGYLNPPLCRDVCPMNKYGPDCLMMCHCVEGDTCDNVQGVCSSLHCHPDWEGVGCSKRLPKLHSAPRVVVSTCTSARLQWQAWEAQLDTGHYPVLEYRLYMASWSREAVGPWVEVARRQEQEGVPVHIAEVALPSSSNPRGYKFRVDAYYNDAGKVSSRASPGLETDIVFPCAAQLSVDTLQKFVSKGKVIQNIRHHMWNNREVEVTWSVADPSLVPSLHVTYSYELRRVGDCQRAQAGGVTSLELAGNRSSLMLHNLEPWRTYSFILHATSPFLPPAGEVTEGTFATASEAPSGPVQDVEISNVTSTSASVSWLDPPCPERGGPLVHYELELIELANDSSLPVVFYPGTRDVGLYELRPDKRYCLRVRYVNAVGPGPFNTCAIFSTPPVYLSARARPLIPDGKNRFPRSLPPQPTSLRQTSSTVQCVGMAWEMPPASYSSPPIQGFRIFDLSNRPYVPGMETLALAPGPKDRVAFVCGLQPGRGYMFGLSSRSLTGEDSVPVTSVFTTDHDVPEKPETPKVLNRGLTTVAISIKPVSSQKGPVSSYDIYVDINDISEQDKVDVGIASAPRGLLSGEEREGPYVKKKPDIPEDYPRQDALVDETRPLGRGSVLVQSDNVRSQSGTLAEKSVNPITSEAGDIAAQLRNSTWKNRSLFGGKDLASTAAAAAETAGKGSREPSSDNSSNLPYLIEKSHPDVQKWGVRRKKTDENFPLGPTSLPVTLPLVPTSSGQPEHHAKNSSMTPIHMPGSGKVLPEILASQRPDSLPEVRNKNYAPPSEEEDTIRTHTPSSGKSASEKTEKQPESKTDVTSHTQTDDAEPQTKTQRGTFQSETPNVKSQFKTQGGKSGTETEDGVSQSEKDGESQTETQDGESGKDSNSQTETEETKVQFETNEYSSHVTVAPLETKRGSKSPEIREDMPPETRADKSTFETRESTDPSEGRKKKPDKRKEGESSFEARGVEGEVWPSESSVQVSSVSFLLRGGKTMAVSPSGSAGPSTAKTEVEQAYPAKIQGAVKNSLNGWAAVTSVPAEKEGGALGRGSTSRYDGGPEVIQSSLGHETRENNNTQGNAAAEDTTKNLESPQDSGKIRESAPTDSRRRRQAGSGQNPPPGTIHARLNPERLIGQTAFVIGDGVEYGGYKNRPLKPDGRYTVYFVANSMWNGANKFSVSDPVTVLMPREVTVSTSTPRYSRFANKVTIIVMSCLAFLMSISTILCVACCSCVARRRDIVREGQKAVPAVGSATESAGTPTAPFLSRLTGIELLPVVDERNWSDTYSLTQPRRIATGRNLLPPDQVMLLPKTETPNKGEKVTFRKEFQSLPQPYPASNMAAGQRHFDRNLSASVVLYDSARCILLRDGAGQSDFINASYIRGSVTDSGVWTSYIATQSPFERASAVDLWRLVYQQNIGTVVVLTRPIENGVRKCYQYWPDIGQVSIGPFKISVIDQFLFADFTERHFSVKRRKLRNRQRHLVRHFTFFGWPESGVPSNAIPLLDLHSRVKHMQQLYGPGPLLVHCDTGCGRTAVFIALDMLLSAYETYGEVSVFSTVSALRAKRGDMVPTFQHYTFLYDALFESKHAGNTEVGDDLHLRFQQLLQRNPATGRSYLRDQFLLLRLVCAQDLQLQLRRPGSSRNVPDLIPARSLAQSVKRADGMEEEEDLQEMMEEGLSRPYKGAIFVDSYRRRNQFVLAPTPTAFNVGEFLQLVYNHNITSIIMLDSEEVKQSPENSRYQRGQYWPKEKVMQCEPFIVELVASNSQNGILTRTLTLTHKYRSTDDHRCFRQFHLQLRRPSPSQAGTRASPDGPISSCWPPFTAKLNLISLLNLVKAWQTECSLDSTPVLLHCQNGVLKSGLVAALALIMNRIDEDSHVSVYRQVRRLQRRCPDAVGHFDQYRFLYKALWDYINISKPGGVFSYNAFLPLENYPEEVDGSKLLDRKSHAGGDRVNDGEPEFDDLVDTFVSVSATYLPRRPQPQPLSSRQPRSPALGRPVGFSPRSSVRSPLRSPLSPRRSPVLGGLSATENDSSTSESSDDDNSGARARGPAPGPSSFSLRSPRSQQDNLLARRRHLSWSPVRDVRRPKFTTPERPIGSAGGGNRIVEVKVRTECSDGSGSSVVGSPNSNDLRFKQHSLYPDLSPHRERVRGKSSRTESPTPGCTCSPLTSQQASRPLTCSPSRGSPQTSGSLPRSRQLPGSPSRRGFSPTLRSPSAYPPRQTPATPSPHRTMTLPSHLTGINNTAEFSSDLTPTPTSTSSTTSETDL